jgi:hypothetical protein
MSAGQGAGLIDAVQPIREIMTEFVDRSRDLSAEIGHFLQKDN